MPVSYTHLTGDGSGKPTGIFAASGGADVGITSAAAAALTADELIDLFYSLRSPYRKKAVWVMNDSTVKAIRKLKDGKMCIRDSILYCQGLCGIHNPRKINFTQFCGFRP